MRPGTRADARDFILETPRPRRKGVSRRLERKTIEPIAYVIMCGPVVRESLLRYPLTRMGFLLMSLKHGLKLNPATVCYLRMQSLAELVQTERHQHRERAGG